MAKKISIFFIVLFLSLVFIWGLNKYQQRRERIRLAEQAKNAKAPQQKITLLEGWNNKDIGDYLEKNDIAKAADFLNAQKKINLSNYTLLSSKSGVVDLEGFIFPDTYLIPSKAPSGTDISSIIIKKALDNFSQKMTPKLISESENQGLNLNQLITLASILEKESGKSLSEKKIIAGIFYNRLKISMPLQSDATVNYVTGKSQAQPLLDDTKIDSPYNTYKYAGLPPGPICNPGLDAIIAAAEPATNSYLYFLHDQKTGQAYYSKTLDEHNTNKAKYLR